MVCCITGHRPKGFPFPRDVENEAYRIYRKALTVAVKELVENGFSNFICGMADGADMDFAETVVSFRDVEGYPIELEAALPYPITSSKKESLLQKCNGVNAISPYYHGGCMQKRNCYMVDRSDIVLAVWNGIERGGTWNTVNYAKQKGKPVRYIMLDEIIKP